ncbi:3'-5' exonuclease [Lacibacterium aquatile]|uniref:3'-5' exonuclease n=1 Tax=Lacibacterium aquatile TaxID=1168082 RepID=A0ABW5DX31_9PROT
MSDDIAAARALLEAQGCRVIDRLEPRASYGDLDSGEEVGQLVLIDSETTGLEVEADEVIQLAMVKLEYGRSTGRLGRVLGTFDRLRQPSRPITLEITKLTGITNEMVAGHRIDDQEVAAFLGGAALVVAHNASFDRPFTEKHWPVFTDVGWACSLTEIDWRSEGFEGSKLGHLGLASGFWFAGHNALNDVWALAELLARPLPVTGDLGLAALLSHARQPVCRVWAVDAPYEARLMLKARGYRWSPGEKGAPRCWFKDVPRVDLEVEELFLVDECLAPAASMRVVAVPPRNRYSARAIVG